MINVQNLTYQYPHADRPALQHVSFTVDHGACIGVVGPNGAGKSTLCYALMGLAPHFYHGTISGDVFIDGVNAPDVDMGTMSQYVGLVFQDPSNQFSGAKLSVEEEIAFGLENLGVDRRTMNERIDYVTDLLGISNLRKRNPYQLSGGQMQRVAIASVMALQPKVLVMDEPSSQLDPVGTHEVFSAIDSLSQQGVTTVVVEHKPELLSEFCSKVLLLVGGEVKAFDTPGKIFSHPDLQAWGVDAPRVSQAYRAIDTTTDSLPTTLHETVRMLKQYERRTTVPPLA